MKKLKYYLETTIFNFVFADDSPDKKEVTEKLFNTWANLNGEMYISEIVIDEIERCSEPKRSKMYDLTQKFNPTILESTEEVRELAKRYIMEGIIPERYRNDALHIAVATVNSIDVVVSWNLEHIVKLKTRYAVSGINKFLGYKEVEIVTPEEVI